MVKQHEFEINLKRLEDIIDVLHLEYINAKHIAILTGLSRDKSQELRKEIIKSNKSNSIYTTYSKVKIEDFLEFYNSRKLHSIYENIFGIGNQYSFQNCKELD